MNKIISSKSIGAYSLAIDDEGMVTIEGAHLPGPLLFEAGQSLDLLQWLSQQQELLRAKTTVPPVETVVPPPATTPSEGGEEIVLRVIGNAIALAREHYPAGLDFEHRDRFIDQISRDPAVKPLVTQGQISRKQIMLWIGQQLDTSTQPLWTQDQRRGRRFRS